MAHCRIRIKLHSLGAPSGRSPHAAKVKQKPAACMGVEPWTRQNEHLQALSELAMKCSMNVTAEHVQEVGLRQHSGQLLPGHELGREVITRSSH